MKNKIITALLVVGAVVAAALVMRQRKFTKYWYKIAMKNDAILKLITQWNEMEKGGITTVDKLLKKGYKSVAIYGLGVAGERLVNDLKDSEVDIKYVIDKKAEEKLSFVEIVKPEDVEKVEADVLIVTAICNYDDIKSVIEEKCSCPIISLEDIIYEE